MGKDGGVDRGRRIFAEDTIDMAGRRDFDALVEGVAVHRGEGGHRAFGARREEGGVERAVDEQCRDRPVPDIRLAEQVARPSIRTTWPARAIRES